MTLRLKLFVLIGGLLALMVGAEWLLIETLTKDLRVEVTAVATSVGKDIVRILHPVDERARGALFRQPGVRRIVIRDEARVAGSAGSGTGRSETVEDRRIGGSRGDRPATGRSESS